MFVRKKRSGKHIYLQVVVNRRENGRVRQRVLMTLGRLDQLQESGELDSLLRSGARFAESMLVLTKYDKGEGTEVDSRRIGPGMVFDRLWRETGCQAVLTSLLAQRKFEFPVERAVFMTVLHRLFESGSDRAADEWRSQYVIPGTQDLQLHHVYRAMAWLGEELGLAQQRTMTRFGPRCTKDLVEEALFARRRDLFTSLDIAFFDTTSIYFEGRGGETLGKFGKSKDKRPDRKQMVVGAVLDDAGRPVCCEMWPGNASDVQALVPVVDRLRKRFHVGRVCVVADRGMISAKTMAELERRGWLCILGARMRKVKEVRDQVLARAGRYQVVRPKGSKSKDPSPLKVKQVTVGDRRHVVCLNVDQATKDAADREAIVAALRDKLKQGDKSLVGNRGFRRFLQVVGEGFRINDEAIKAEARYDGKWVLRTNTDLSAADVALKYKQLWMVERLFRDVKTLLETRPIWHKWDATIRGHVFCSFLALVLIRELQDRLERHDCHFEWADIIRDLDRLEQVDIEQDGKRFLVRKTATGCAGKVFQAVGVALPPFIRQVGPEESP